jgi:hypothetical protein
MDDEKDFRLASLIVIAMLVLVALCGWLASVDSIELFIILAWLAASFALTYGLMAVAWHSVQSRRRSAWVIIAITFAFLVNPLTLLVSWRLLAPRPSRSVPQPG